MNFLLATVVFLPLVLGTLLCFWLGRSGSPASRRAVALAAAAVTALAFGLLVWASPAVFAGNTLIEHVPWVPSIGLDLSFRLDGLSLLFGGLVSGMGLLIILYAAYYLGPEDSARKFFTTLMLFMAAMLGVVLSDNLLLLVVFWELTSISSFLLVGFWGHRHEARFGARMALAITGGGGLVMLAGVLLLGQIAGTYEISEMAARASDIQAHGLYPLALILVLIGCFTKSAQFPFHFWLPDAMAAPTPVSAYLHSATMVKAGVFLLARLYPVLGGTGLFEAIVSTVGLVTLAFAAWVAIFRHDLKGLLAYSTISHLGLITFLLGLASPLSAVAAVFHILNHASFKAALFMTAGIIDHETGTRDMRRLGGLMRVLPWTGTVAAVAAAAMAGLPLANGFLSKEMFFAEAVTASDMPWGWIVPVVATLAGVFSMAYSVRFVHDVFFNGEAKDLPNPHPHEPPMPMRAPVAILAVVCVIVGIFPALTFGPLVHVAAAAVLGTAPPDYHLALWHGFNLPLLMSAVAVVGGAALYFALLRRFELHGYHARTWGGRKAFQGFVDGLLAGARHVTAALENGSLQRYAAWMMGLAILLALGPFLLGRGGELGAGARELLPAPGVAVAVWLLLLAVGAALLVTHRSRFIAVVLAGAVGLVASLSFVALSAPDLAMTQLSVDVVSTVLLMMGLALLPQTSPKESGTARRLRDAALALAGGGGVAWLSWLMLTRDHDSISWYFLDKSLSEGGGSNVVNVILVDFRGYDTFGEITVLAIAGIGVLALLDGLRAKRPTLDPQGRPWSYSMEPLMLRVIARLVLPIALVFSAYIFWRGHNLPGGGFIAGLITAVALVLQYMGRGQASAEAVLHAGGGRRFTRWVGTGLGIAWLTGVGAFLFGRPFLKSAHGHPTVPLLGELPLATAALFDLGVYITVVGATLLTLSVLGNASRDPSHQKGAL